MIISNFALFGGITIKNNKEFRKFIKQLPRKERKKERDVYSAGYKISKK